MKFRSEYIAHPLEPQIKVFAPLVTLGSCFSDNIGTALKELYWDVAANPCGVLFNPMSIANVIKMAVAKEDVDDSFGIEQSSQEWIATAMSGIRKISEENCRQECESRLDSLKKVLCKQGVTLIVTFGTAWIYEDLNNDNAIVANCYKLPAERFRRRKVGVQEIADRWIDVIESLWRINDSARVIFTVSPVRHLRDDFVENTRSKATLALAVEEILQKVALEYSAKKDMCGYFPAYEIMIDDLRDYRFVAADLAHPSEQAVEYIKEKFIESYLSKKDREVIKEAHNIARRISHRLDINSVQGNEFRKETLRLLQDFKKRNNIF